MQSLEIPSSDFQLGALEFRVLSQSGTWKFQIPKPEIFRFFRDFPEFFFHTTGIEEVNENINIFRTYLGWKTLLQKTKHQKEKVE